MKHRKELDRLLRDQASTYNADHLSEAMCYAQAIVRTENAIAVVSDLANGRSHIVAGDFGKSLGLDDYKHEDSIWESKILSLMTPDEQEQKYIAELRFFHYLRHLPKLKRPQYHLVSKLHFCQPDGHTRELLHRMYYIYSADCETVECAICLYSPLVFDFNGKSHAVNSVTGMSEELTTHTNGNILSRRERQILALIDSGMKSAEIADLLNISIHTVSRHRQEILSKLQVKNSHEACRRAKSMGIVS